MLYFRQATFRKEGKYLNYKPVADVVAGQVVVLGNTVYIAPADIPANTTGSLSAVGAWDVTKDASVFAAGDNVYWNPTGNPTGGTAGTGCATSNAAGAYFMGTVPPSGAALTGDAIVAVFLGDMVPNSIGANLVSTIGASTAAAGTTTADAGVLPAGTGSVYPTTAADDTKGVRIHVADKVKGRTLFIGNGVGNKILKVYAPAGGNINGLGADAAFSSVSGKGVTIVCLDVAANTWLAA